MSNQNNPLYQQHHEHPSPRERNEDQQEYLQYDQRQTQQYGGGDSGAFGASIFAPSGTSEVDDHNRRNPFSTWGTNDAQREATSTSSFEQMESWGNWDITSVLRNHSSATEDAGHQVREGTKDTEKFTWGMNTFLGNEFGSSHFRGTSPLEDRLNSMDSFFATPPPQAHDQYYDNIFDPSSSTTARQSSDLARDRRKPNNLQNEIEELRAVLLGRRKKLLESQAKMRKESECLNKEITPFNIDKELERLGQTYQIPTDDHQLDIDGMLERLAASIPNPSSATVANSAGQNISNRAFSGGSPGQQSGGSSEILQTIRTLNGSQKIQQSLDRLVKLRLRGAQRTEEHQELTAFAKTVFTSTQSNLAKFLTHRSANYAVSKLFEVLEPFERYKFLSEIQNRLDGICRHQHGTFALQKIIAAINEVEHISMIVNGLKPHVRALALDQHATFTLQKLLGSPVSPGNSDLVGAFLFQSSSHVKVPGVLHPEDVRSICHTAKNKHGAMFLTSLLRKANDEDFKSTVNLLLPSFLDISCGTYGNYVAQVALERAANLSNDSNLVDSILATITEPPESLAKVAMNDFGSKVLLSSLSLQSWVRSTVTMRMFGVNDAGVCTHSLPYLRDLMFSQDASTLLKRALRLETMLSIRKVYEEPLWAVLNNEMQGSSWGGPEVEKWINFLQKL